MAVNAKLKAKVNGFVEELNIASNAASIQMADGTTVEAKIGEVVNAVNEKASKSELSAEVSTLNTAIGKKADQTAVDTAVEGLEADIALKADQADLESAVSTLNSAIDQKADKSTVEALTGNYENVATKSEVEAEVTALNTAIGKKADQTALESAISTINTSLADKADKTTVATDIKTAVDKAVGDLIGSAPETYNTLGEIATYIDEHRDVVDALNAAIGEKASKTELESEVSTLNTAIGKKADQTAVDAAVEDLEADIALKASKTELEGEVSTLNTAIGKKADQTAVDTALAGKVDKVEGKGLSTKDFTQAFYEKLNAIEAGANKYVHPAHTAHTSGLYKVTVDAEGHVSAATPVVKQDIVDLGIPGALPTVDAEISATSENAVQNKAVAAKFTELGQTINNVSGVAESKSTIYYSATEPAGMKEGDLWVQLA